MEVVVKYILLFLLDIIKLLIYVSQIFDGVKSVALWFANIKKLAKDHKSYGSAAMPNTSYNFY